MTHADQKISKMLNGIYTITGPKGHRTFEISTVENPASALYGKRIIGLLAGSDNESDYRNFGFVTETGIAVWKKNRGNGQKSAYEIFAQLLWALATGEGAERYPNYSLLTEGRCIRCNRRLTEPQSIITGIGPVCAQRGLHGAA